MKSEKKWAKNYLAKSICSWCFACAMQIYMLKRHKKKMQSNFFFADRLYGILSFFTRLQMLGK